MTGGGIVVTVVLGILALVGLVALVVVAWAGPRRALAWRVLRQGEAAPERRTRPTAEPRPAPRAEPPPLPVRNDGLALLAILQQEARLIDFLKESLDGYSDAQVGAAVRDVHRDAAAVVERLFAVRALRKEPEGADVVVPPGFDAGTVRLTGALSGQPPYRGKLRHPGWEATRVEMPRWTGTAQAARVVAPAEIEVK
jgi:hypothetical protein